MSTSDTTRYGPDELAERDSLDALLTEMASIPADKLAQVASFEVRIYAATQPEADDDENYSSLIGLHYARDMFGNPCYTGARFYDDPTERPSLDDWPSEVTVEGIGGAYRDLPEYRYADGRITTFSYLSDVAR